MTEEIAKLKQEINDLKSLIKRQNNAFKSDLGDRVAQKPNQIPDQSSGAQEVKSLIENDTVLDFCPQLNTSSYVNVMLEEEEEAVALMGLKVNLADQTVYPQSYKIHNALVNMIADLWHCPKPSDFDEYGAYAGACTVGSTEACLLAGLALKFRWRKWYAKRHNLDTTEILKERPNIIISTCFQAAWEKLIRYLDIDCKLIQPSSKTFTVDPKEVGQAIDEHTIGVVAIMGNHYGGQYDPVWEIDDVVTVINQKNNYQVGIHIDAASGGFIAPFQASLPAWDFRLDNVLSISASGHKYGESCCGTGWILWRERKDLSEHVAISVTYLGGKADSYTLNFSRPASGVYVQYYKFLRYGHVGYQKCCDSMMDHADRIRRSLKAMQYEGKPRFIILDHGQDNCLPVVTARLNPNCHLEYDDIALQHALSQHHWYVSGYRMGFRDPVTEQLKPLFCDQDAESSMFRVVIKSNISSPMVEHLLESFEKALSLLDLINFKQHNKFSAKLLRHKDQTVSNPC